MKLKKLIKNSFILVVVLLILLLAAAIVIPYFFKDEIVTVLKEETNKNLNAKVDFTDINISLLRSFPALNVQLENLTVDGVNEFEDIQLFSTPSVELEMDLLKAWKDMESIPVETVNLSDPELNILVLKDGRANWDIAKPSENPNSESAAFLVEMEQYTIQNGTLTYQDENLDFQMKMTGLNHTGSGKFSANVFDLDTKTNIAGLTANMEGISYLRKAKVELDAVINMNIPELIFALKDNSLTVNDLVVQTEGTIDINEENYVLDLKFASPQTDFRSLWSIIPAAYTADYASATINGTMTLEGFIKGIYNGTKGIYPAFQIKTDVGKGQVKYPDLPIGISGIFANVFINSPSSDFDKMVVDITQFKFQLGNNPMAGNFHLKTPISNPALKTAIKGTLDLEAWTKAFPMEGIKNMKGVINSDIALNATMSQIEKEEYDKVDIMGDFEATDLFIQQEEVPDIHIHNLETNFSPQRVELVNFDAQLGKSDLTASGQIDNILAYFSPEMTMEGSFQVHADYFDANEWIATETASSSAARPISNQPQAEIFDRFNFDIIANFKKLEYDVYELSDLTTKGTINPKRTTINHFYTKIEESDINATGAVNNLFGYLFDEEVLSGKIDLSADYLNLNQFMTQEESTSTEMIPVPENIDIEINTDLKKVTYTNFDLKNIKGAILVQNSAALMKNVKGALLGGEVTFEGMYDTKDLSKPKFDIKTTLNQLNFNTAFNTFNTFERLAPIGKFVDGKFNTTLSMNGVLGKDLIPDLGTLNLSGFFHTLNGVIDGFKPLKALGEKLNVEAIKTFKIKDSKNWIEVKDGFVEVKEFEHKIDDISLIIRGKHSLTQVMNYVIKARIPRKLLERNAASAAANQGWSFLSKEAQKVGINIQDGEFVNLKIDLSGSMLNPVFKITPVAADGETSVQDATKATIEEAVNTAVDSVKTVLDEKVNEIEKEAESIKDSVKTVANQEAEKAKEATKKTAENALDSLAKGGKIDLNKNPLDSIDLLKDSTLNKEADKLKDKVKDILPFGKKKKKGSN